MRVADHSISTARPAAVFVRGENGSGPHDKGDIMQTFTRTAAGTAILACALGTDLAAARPLQVYEPFGSAGALSGAVGGQCGGVFWPNPWTAGPFFEVGTSLNHPLALPSSGLRCVGSGAMEGWRNFCGLPLSPFGNDLWVSALIRSPSAAPSDMYFQLNDFTGAYVVAIVRSAGNPVQLLFPGGPTSAGVASGVGATDMIVIRIYSPFPGQVEAVAYVNPSNETSPHSPPLNIVAPAFNLTQVYMRITGDQQIDEIRIGDTFDEVAAGAGGGCYPDCNLDGVLTLADFGCFQTKFVAGDPYADCNGVGGLTIADFGCFQTKFVAGCP